VRLQLTVILGVAVAAAPAALAADRVSVEPVTRFALYRDSDATTIWTAATGVTGKLDERWELGARYLVDVVSSASVDVITQATSRFEDTRHDIAVSGGLREPERSVVVGYSHSTENDWQSHNASLSGSLDVLQRNLTLSASLGFQDNTITRANSFGFEENLRVLLGTLGASYTLTPRDLVALSLASSYYDGFQSSPYRYVPVAGQALLERQPEQRFRQALVLRHHHYLGDGWALRSHARLYADTYGVKALTLGAESVFENAPFDGAFSVRGYQQTRARFYRAAYPSEQRYMTIDKELSPFFDVFAGPTLGYGRAQLGPSRGCVSRRGSRASTFTFPTSPLSTNVTAWSLISVRAPLSDAAAHEQANSATHDPRPPDGHSRLSPCGAGTVTSDPARARGGRCASTPFSGDRQG
jgi:hypothetical protein